MAILAVTAVAVSLLGCLESGEDKAVSKITTLNVGYQPSTHQVAEMVAMEKGWWLEDLKPFGIEEIKEFEFPSGPPEMLAMRAGELDIAYVGAAPPIAAIDQGLDAKIVAAAQTQGSDLVLRPDIGYEGPESLQGLTIATFPPGSIQDTVFKRWLKDNGLDPDKDLRIVPMGPGEAVTAILAQQVDGVFLPHPAPSTVELQGRGISVASSGEMWPGHGCCCLVVSGKLMRDHPDMVDQIIETHIKATEYINEHPDEAADVFSKRTQLDLDVVKYSIDTWDGAWVADPELIVPSALEYAKVNYDLGYTRKILTKEDLFDTSFYEQATH